MTLEQVNLIPWYVCGGYFVLSALRVKRAKVKEPLVNRLGHTTLLVVAFFLMFANLDHVPVLGARLLPLLPSLQYLGIALTCVGIGITLWSRLVLGTNWSGRVTLKEDHTLIRSGPYAYVRHPLYTGILIALVGTALVVGEWRTIPAFLIAVIGFSLKARREEALLRSEFKDSYEGYTHETRFLIPRFRPAKQA